MEPPVTSKSRVHPHVARALHECDALVVGFGYVIVEILVSVDARGKPAVDHRGDRPQARAELAERVGAGGRVGAGHAEDVVAGELRVHRGAVQEILGRDTYPGNIDYRGLTNG